MKKYVDGFVIPIAWNKLDEYRKMAELACSVWKEHGALDYVECVGDDLDHPGMVSFRQLAQASADETVIFAWITFESRVHRDQVNQAVFADPRLTCMMHADAQPFDCKRMAYGGFGIIVTG